MVFYLAARHVRRAEMAGHAAMLHGMDHRVVGRWLAPGSSASALERMEDIYAADVVVCFMEPRPSGDQDRLVELGLALAWKKRVLMVGARETRFADLPLVEFFESWGECWRALAGREEGMPTGELDV